MGDVVLYHDNWEKDRIVGWIWRGKEGLGWRWISGQRIIGRIE